MNISNSPSPARRRSRVRADILAAAAAEISEAGVEKASLRAIARRVGISHQALSYHFTDRRAVLTALAVDGFRQLVALSADAVEQVESDAPLGHRAAAIGIAYVRFAERNRPLFTLMLGSAQIDPTDEELVAARLAMWILLLATATTENDNGWGGSADPETMAILAWMIVHGMATIGDLIPTDVDPGDLVLILNRAIAIREDR
ncbi:TetR/AcrR family transcriptional regulator [Rhodococcus tibetensis]|uniref:TetR/AcrR family transcriptional regulator n=1 Tax=Rhodococcus tibetensis TaxID=2965064 RepID=A0ABT1QGF5_9NOCA|nr:TetR/AcrR family transcriptional regulator [Rhodococcus sp. FXJ9.536]MCQ4121359.1 TetR/AcrR family transcriptional regulator [Rhodococcus sp. FXJ9.536]